MSTTSTTPEPMPADGYRKLSPSEVVRRQHALTCIRNKDSAQCQGQVYATVFFDGTGNNMTAKDGTTQTQEERNKHSNVARLYKAAIAEPDSGFFPYYIPGVGEPFDKIGDLDGGKLLFGKVSAGGAAGYMGADRINWGITRLYNAVHRYLTSTDLFDDNQAKTIVKNMSSSLQNSLPTPAGLVSLENSYRRMVLKTWEGKLAAVVQRSQRKVTQINVAVFGFSRGSAEARAFGNWLSELLKQDEGGYALAGVPLRIYFMGLFDTVASVGAANLVPGINGHMAWADGCMYIAPAVEQCVHYIALHEQRASFPLETAVKVKQVAYPGMHSDVGGGYLPTEQGKLGQLSQIPLNDMHYEAFKAGVPLHSQEEIKGRPDLQKDFFIPPDLIKAYNAFWQACGGAAGTSATQALLHHHTQQYLQWRGGLFVRGEHLETRKFYQRATLKDKDGVSDAQKLLDAQNDFQQQIADLRERLDISKESGLNRIGRLASSYASKGVPGMAYEAYQGRPIDDETRDLLKAMDSHANLPEAVRVFMDDYLHDSRAGFRDIPISKLEPHQVTGGYLRYRNIYQNPRNETKTSSIDALSPLPPAASSMEKPSAVA